MTRGAARVEDGAGTTTETEAGAPDDRERAVEAIAQLLSSGRPISEILDAAKRLAQSRATEPNGEAEPGKPSFHIVGKSCTSASNLETALTEPIDATIGQHAAGSANLLDLTNNALLIDGPSDSQQSSDAVPLRGAWQTLLFGLLRPMIFWLVPALSLTVLVTAGISIDGGVTRKAAGALANAIDGTALSGEIGPLSSGAAGTASLVVTPERAEPPQRPESSPAELQRPEPGRAEPRLTPEEIKALLDRGNALVSRADVVSARLFYERAAAVGNAEAAVRLGATYDPAFLAQPRLGHVRRDQTIAQYWYRRARDLGAKQSEMPLHSDAPADHSTEPGQ